MVFSPNDSPLAGREGAHLTGSKIGERLAAEAATSVSLRVLPVAGGGGEAFEVQARGELQLGLLIGARAPACGRFLVATMIVSLDGDLVSRHVVQIFVERGKRCSTACIASSSRAAVACAVLGYGAVAARCLAHGWRLR